MIANLAILLLGPALAAPTPCANLKSLTIANTTITLAESVKAGTFTPPPAAAPPAAPAPQRAPGDAAAPGGGGGQRGAGAAPAALAVPAFCRVAATLRPSSDSQIDMEVWLPENWNGKFQFVGGGGCASVLSYPALATALNEG